MTIKKFQHYVPKFYLKSFSFNNKKPYALYCFDKTNENIFVSNIDKTCGEFFFYDTSEDYEQSVENSLSKLEFKFSSSYKELIKCQDLKLLTKKDKTFIAAFLLTQWFRTKGMREILRDYNRQTINFLNEKILSKKVELSNNLKKQLDISDSYTKDIHIPLLREILDRIPYVMKMKWSILINKTNMPFWTSDNPIAFDNFVNPSQFNSYGLFSEGINIHFPLSPEISLTVADPHTFYFFPDKMELNHVDNVVYQNALQAKSSYRTILSNENNFNLAKQIVNDNPSLKNLDRKRWNVEFLKDYFKKND